MNQEELDIAQRIASELMGWKQVPTINSYTQEEGTVFAMDTDMGGQTRIIIGHASPVINAGFRKFGAYNLRWRIWRPFADDWVDVIKGFEAQGHTVSMEWSGDGMVRCLLTGGFKNDAESFSMRINQVSSTPGDALCGATINFLETLSAARGILPV